MKQTNVFHKGIIADLHPSKITPDSWVFPTQNIRIFNKDGQGFVATSLPGNEKKVSIRNNYQVIGACVYDGVAYIVSSHRNGTGAAEIGCYPSPRSYNVTMNQTNPDLDVITYTTNAGWTRTYKPLVNFTKNINPNNNVIQNSDRRTLSTVLLNSYPSKQISMFAREDYDESLTLFMTDFSDPIKVINTGIKKDGTLNKRYLWNDSFPNQVSLIPGNSGLLTVSQFNVIEQTGKLKYGNYIYFFQYLDGNLTPTDIVGESRVCQVYDGVPWNGPSVQGGHGGSFSDKKVQLVLQNLDVNYAYVQVSYIRYYSDNSNSVFIDESQILNPFPINGQTSITIEHVNHDNEKDIDIIDVIKQTGYFRTCRDITHIGNKFYGANWKGIERHNDVLAKFAERIKIGCSDKDVIDVSVNADAGSMHDKQYKNYRLTYNNVGYFRGETYSFAPVFIFTDGYRSLGYPCRGIDAYNLTPGQINSQYVANSSLVNNKGVFRFPSRNKSSLYASSQKVKLMAVQFMLNDAVTWLQNNATQQERDWFVNNIRGIMFIRTDRHENLLYQGLTIHNCRSLIGTTSFHLTDRYLNNTPPSIKYTTINNTQYIYFDGQGSNAQGKNERNTTAQIPLMYRELPWWWSRKSNVDNKREHFATRFWAVPNSYAFISSDYISMPDKRNKISFIQEIGKVRNTHFTKKESWEVFPQRYLYAMNNLDEHWYTMKSQPLVTNQLFDVPENTFPGAQIDSKYCSASKDGRSLDNAGTDVCLLYQDTFTGDNKARSVRDMRTCRYLGIQTTNNEQALYSQESYQQYDYNNSIVNLYSINPSLITDIEAAYFNINAQYYQISDVIDLSNILSLTGLLDYNVYSGDCFLQLSFIKQMGWYDTWYRTQINTSQGINFQDTEGASVWYGHGVILGLVTENAINHAMRYAIANSTYYPLSTNAELFARESRFVGQGNEQFHYNRGYDKTLSIRDYILYDSKLPLYVTKKPTMVQMSEQHYPYSFVDSYRILPILAKQEFDIQYGEIMNIGHLGNFLYTVQREAVNQHFTGEKTLFQDADVNSANIVLGDASELSDKQRELSNFGTQHQWSVVQTDNAVYGVDWNKGIIWQLKIYTTDKGGTRLMVIDLTKQKAVRKWIADLKEEFGFINTDKAEKELLDNPAHRTGIISGYDRENDEVLFSFVMTRKNRVEPDIRTIVFNESLGFFTGGYTCSPNFYMTINNDFYSILNENNINDLYLHNIKSKNLEFYGKDKEAIISILVNGLINEETNATGFNKQYDAVSIESQETPFDKVEYETEFQKSSHNPFINTTEFWLNPEYQEGKWKFPINEAQQSSINQYGVSSQMKGEWLKITLYYKNKLRMVIKNISTIFKISHS